MTVHRAIVPQGPVSSDWFNTIQQFISTFVSPNFAVSILNNTTLQVVAGVDNDQVTIGIKGRWRYISASVQAAAPGGLTVGKNPIFVCASDNSFQSNGAGNVETDNTVYAFTLVVLPSGSTPSGTGSQALFRQVGWATWDGSKFTVVETTAVGGQQAPAGGSDLASQTTLPVVAPFHRVTGTTTIDYLNTAGYSAGDTVKLQFTSGPVQIAHNVLSPPSGSAAILLQGGLNAGFITGETLTLVFDGTSWWEDSRSPIHLSGETVTHNGSAVPSGLLREDGSAVSRTTQRALFANIGTLHGVGDGSTTFNLPDTRGRVDVGYASGGHTDVATIGLNDGVSLSFRRPKHRHTVHTHTANSQTGAGFNGSAGGAPPNSGTITAADGGSGNANDPLDGPAYYVRAKFIRI